MLCVCAYECVCVFICRERGKEIGMQADKKRLQSLCHTYAIPKKIYIFLWCAYPVSVLARVCLRVCVGLCAVNFHYVICVHVYVCLCLGWVCVAVICWEVGTVELIYIMRLNPLCVWSVCLSMCVWVFLYVCVCSVSLTFFSVISVRWKNRRQKKWLTTTEQLLHSHYPTDFYFLTGVQGNWLFQVVCVTNLSRWNLPPPCWWTNAVSNTSPAFHLSADKVSANTSYQPIYSWVWL